MYRMFRATASILKLVRLVLLMLLPLLLCGCIPQINEVPTRPELPKLEITSLGFKFDYSPSDRSLCNGEHLKISILEEDYLEGGEEGKLFALNGQVVRKKEYFLQLYLPPHTFYSANKEVLAYPIEFAARSSNAKGGKWKSLLGHIKIKDCAGIYPVIGIRPSWANPNQFSLYLKNAEELKGHLLVRDGEFTLEEVTKCLLEKKQTPSCNNKALENALKTKVLDVRWKSPDFSDSAATKVNKALEFTAGNLTLKKSSLNNYHINISAQVKGFLQGEATINFNDQNAFSARYGIVRAPSTKQLLRVSDKQSTGSYSIEPASEKINFDKVVKETRFCDFKRDPTLQNKLSPAEYLSFADLINYDAASDKVSFKNLNQNSLVTGQVTLPFKSFVTPEGINVFYADKHEDAICGVSYYFIGSTDSGKRGEAILHFDTHINPYEIEEVILSPVHILNLSSVGSVGSVEGVGEIINEEGTAEKSADEKANPEEATPTNLKAAKTSIVLAEEEELLYFLTAKRQTAKNQKASASFATESLSRQLEIESTSILSEEDIFYLQGNIDSLFPSQDNIIENLTSLEIAKQNSQNTDGVATDKATLAKNCFLWDDNCDFSNEKWGWVVMPSFIVNAKKGDVFLTTSCNFTSLLLNQVNPPQIYSHTGIMTENYDMIRHSVAAPDRATSYVDISFSKYPRIPTEKVHYMWPGTINQTITKAVDGDYFEDRDNKGEFRVSGLNPFNFKVDRSSCRDQELLLPIIMKPPPEEEFNNPKVRNILHEIANTAKGINGYYKLYDYSNAEKHEKEPAPGKWYDNYYNTVCSTFVRLAATLTDSYQKEFMLEGHKLESIDIQNGAQGTQYSNTKTTPDSNNKTTPAKANLEKNLEHSNKDGLYFYDKEERKSGAEFVYSYIEKQVIDSLGGSFPALFINSFIEGATSAIPNQYVHCFALGQCQPLGARNFSSNPNSEWLDPKVGLTVSPDNLLFWDSPSDGGVYGYHEPIEYSPKRFIFVPLGNKQK